MRHIVAETIPIADIIDLVVILTILIDDEFRFSIQPIITHPQQEQGFQLSQLPSHHLQGH